MNLSPVSIADADDVAMPDVDVVLKRITGSVEDLILQVTLLTNLYMRRTHPDGIPLRSQLTSRQRSQARSSSNDGGRTCPNYMR